MQVQTDKQAIVFYEEDSAEENEAPRKQQNPQQAQQLFTNQLPLPDPSNESQGAEADEQRRKEWNNEKGYQGEEAVAQLPLHELDIGDESEVAELSPRETSKETMEHEQKVVSAKAQVESAKNNLTDMKIGKKQAEVIQNSPIPLQRQSNGVAEKQTSHRFRDINPDSPKGRSTHKLVEKVENHFEPSNITKGMFGVGEPEVENQQTQNDLMKKNETEPFQRLNQSINSIDHRRKLPPIIQSPRKQPSPRKKILINYPNDSSISCLQKYEKEEIKLPEQHEEYQKSSLVYEEEENASPKLAMKKAPPGKMSCKVQRERKCPVNFENPEFVLLLQNNQSLLYSKKQWGNINSHYNISFEAHNYMGDSQSFAGYLKGNFGGTCFNLFAKVNGRPQLTATICYRPELKCSSTFRKIEVFVKSEQYAYNDLQGAEDEGNDLEQLYQIGQNAAFRKIVRFVNKVPEWSEKNKCFVLNFRGKSRLPSVKNMILIDGSNKREGLLFCKTDTNEFYMDVSYPLSPFIAFGIVLTAFDFKLLCE